MKLLNFLALILIIVGALNWGLWGFFQFDFVAWFAKGNTSWLARFVYAVIGLAGVWSFGFLSKCRKICCSEDKEGSGSCKM